MPTYEYECPKCQHRFEAFQSITEDPLGKCPLCGAKPDRLIGTGSGIIFKGPGFYATDYKSSGSKSKESKDKAISASSCPGDCSSCKAPDK